MKNEFKISQAQFAITFQSLSYLTITIQGYVVSIIVLPQVLSTTRLVLITSCIDQNL